MQLATGIARVAFAARIPTPLKIATDLRGLPIVPNGLTNMSNKLINNRLTLVLTSGRVTEEYKLKQGAAIKLD